jgi:hypothetical protein
MLIICKLNVKNMLFFPKNLSMSKDRKGVMNGKFF